MCARRRLSGSCVRGQEGWALANGQCIKCEQLDGFGDFVFVLGGLVSLAAWYSVAVRPVMQLIKAEADEPHPISSGTGYFARFKAAFQQMRSRLADGSAKRAQHVVGYFK